MKLSKDELKEKINGLDVSDEVKITLLEDVEDSFEVTKDNSEELQELQTKYNDLQERYKNRFLNGDDGKKEDEGDEKKDDELKEEEVVEEKDIYKIEDEEEE